MLPVVSHGLEEGSAHMTVFSVLLGCW